MSEFLVLYDYETAGLWGFVEAQSDAEVDAEIVSTIPQLSVVHERPQWLTTDEEEAIRSRNSFALNDPRTYPKWVQALVEERDA